MAIHVTSIVPPSLLRRLAEFRMARRIRRQGSPELSGVLATVEGSADRNRIRKLRRELEQAYRQDPVGAAKYTDFRFWSLLNIERAARIGLHQASSLRIMDLGCGAGYFMAVARALGHDCYGVDLPYAQFSSVEQRVYPEMLSALGCLAQTAPLTVERFSPLPFPANSYDLMTAFWICFNRHRQEDEWGVREWRFFVEDALGSLREGGRIVLELNANPERYGDATYYDADTAAYFQSVGTVERNWVTIPRSR